MRLKIVNTTGLAADTQIVDATTGEPLEGVLAVTIHIAPGQYLTADVQMLMQDCDILAEVEVPS